MHLDETWPEFEPQLVQYARQYKLDFIPSGFFSRLMIRLLQFMTPKVEQISTATANFSFRFFGGTELWLVSPLV
jgi:hypothetical protein